MDASLRNKAYRHNIYQINPGHTEPSDIYPCAGTAIAEDAWALYKFVSDKYDGLRFVLTLWDGEESHHD